jgi:hypothetical protein
MNETRQQPPSSWAWAWKLRVVEVQNVADSLTPKRREKKNALGFDVRTVFVIRTHSNLNSNKRLTLTLGSEESSLYRHYRYRVEREIYLSSLAILDYTLLS